MIYDARTKTIRPFKDSGIIDANKVVKNSLIYGSSIASILLSANCAVLQSGIVYDHDEI
jgi:chaperonin GroEL (HSP60 family)